MKNTHISSHLIEQQQMMSRLKQQQKKQQQLKQLIGLAIAQCRSLAAFTLLHQQKQQQQHWVGSRAPPGEQSAQHERENYANLCLSCVSLMFRRMRTRANLQELLTFRRRRRPFCPIDWAFKVLFGFDCGLKTTNTNEKTAATK